MQKYTKEELFDKLRAKAKTLKRPVTFDEMKDDPEMPDPNLYAYYSGSFAEAAKEAYLVTRGGSNAKAREKEVKKMEEKNKRREFIREDCINYLKKRQEELGRLPKQLEVNIDDDAPSWVTLTKYLGPRRSWDKIIGPPGSTATKKNQPALVVGTKEIDIPVKIIVPDDFHGHVSITIDI